MNVSKLIEKLKEFNPQATVNINAHNKEFPFTIVWGSTDGEGVQTDNCTSMSLYVDDLCQNENGE